MMPHLKSRKGLKKKEKKGLKSLMRQKGFLTNKKENMLKEFIVGHRAMQSLSF